MVPPTSCTSYILSACVAGPLITEPVVMSKREPWHWHMIVVPVSSPAESGVLPIPSSNRSRSRAVLHCKRADDSLAALESRVALLRAQLEYVQAADEMDSGIGRWPR